MLDDDKDGQASLKDVRAAVCTIFRFCVRSALGVFLQSCAAQQLGLRQPCGQAAVLSPMS